MNLERIEEIKRQLIDTLTNDKLTTEKMETVYEPKWTTQRLIVKTGTGTYLYLTIQEPNNDNSL